MKNLNFFGGANVINVLNSIKRGERGVNIVAVVSCDNKLRKDCKDMLGRIIKVCMWNDRPLVSYEGNVEAKANTNFTPQPRNGFTWVSYPFLERKNKDNTEYLTFSYRDCDKGDYKEYYIIDGKKTDKEIVKTYFKEQKHYTPKTQLEVGITNQKDFSKVARYEIEKILYIGKNKHIAIQEYEKYQ